MTALTLTVTLRDLTIGSGTDYPIGEAGPSGLGTPGVRATDVPRGHLSGDVGGDDVLEARTITVPVLINGDTPAEARTLLAALKVAWAPSYTDLPLVLEWEDETTVTYYGRPRGPIELGPEPFVDGMVDVLLTFKALTPFAVGEPVDVAVGSP